VQSVSHYCGPLARLHPLGGVGETNALKSLGRESKGRHYRDVRSGGLAGDGGRDFWRRLCGQFELQALQEEQVIVFRLGMA
jgi:hypothetical protein